MVTLRMDGRCQTQFKDARRLVLIDDREVWVRGRVFAVLSRFAAAPNEWLGPESLLVDCLENLGRIVYEIRHDLGIDILNDRAGHYRLNCVVCGDDSATLQSKWNITPA